MLNYRPSKVGQGGLFLFCDEGLLVGLSMHDYKSVQSVFECEKKNRNALSQNAEGVRRVAVGAEDRARKARGCRYLVHFWSENGPPCNYVTNPAMFQNVVHQL